jgi:hypothetical protein
VILGNVITLLVVLTQNIIRQSISSLIDFILELFFMATKGSVGEYICGHCSATNMFPVKYVDKGGNTTRIILKCGTCKQEDYYDTQTE